MIKEFLNLQLMNAEAQYNIASLKFSETEDKNSEAYTDMLYYQNHIEQIKKFLEVDDTKLRMDITITNCNDGSIICF